MSNIIPFPLVEENKHVADLAELLSKHGMSKDEQGFAEIFNHICSMERDLKKAIGEVTALRGELSVMKEEQKHPIKTMLHKAADSLMSKLKSVYRQILSLKDKFINGCKQAVTDIQNTGIVTANNVVGALNIRDDLQSTKERINEVIAFNERKIANIETAAAEYHTAGRAIKNFGLALVGKETVPDIKPNGKLANLLQAPFRSEIRSLNRSLARTDKALAQLDKLEKVAEVRIERDKPSVVEGIKKHKQATAHDQSEVTTPKKLKVVGQEH